MRQRNDELSVKECPNCGAPMRDGKCNYCSATELAKTVWNEGKCRNCGASLTNNLIKDKQNQFVCRYCGWPVRDKPVEDTLRSPSTPPDPEPLPPNSPTATISSLSRGGGNDIGFYTEMFAFLMMIMIFFALVGPILEVVKKTTGNITTTNHPIDVPTYTPGLSVILLGGAFVAGIILTFVILRNRHRRELQRQRRLLGATTQ